MDPKTQKPQDHVIIFALRDIEPSEELTYDYRFCGEDILPCNCGAPRCRKMVNQVAPVKYHFVDKSEIKQHTFK